MSLANVSGYNEDAFFCRSGAAAGSFAFHGRVKRPGTPKRTHRERRDVHLDRPVDVLTVSFN